MLKNRLMCLLGSMMLFTSCNVNAETPFKATEVVKYNNETVHSNFETFKIQVEKDRVELEKKKEEERQKQQRELEEQKKEPEWQEFILTFYTSLSCENSGSGTKSVTCMGSRLYDGLVASNYYKLNTKIRLEGWGEVVVGDRGSDKYFNNDYRLDVYIPRDYGESDSHYYARVNKMGKIKVKGRILHE